MTGSVPIHWEPEILRLEADWKLLGGSTSSSVEAWESALARMREEMVHLKGGGKWTSGRADLLYVAGRAGDELTHSNILAWLLTPSARHGLRGALLVDLVRQTWGLEIPNPEAAVVRREVACTDALARRIADIVVDAGPMTIVIENKVYADEDERQCEDLHRLWTTPAADREAIAEDVLFVLLSRHGRMPWSIETDAARAGWRALSHEWIAAWLHDHLDQIDSPIARSTVVQYLVSLRPIARRPRS